jgi:hypothetical protein
MTWTWRYLGPDGIPVSPPGAASSGFPSQADAESWVGEVWHDLVEEDVDAVELYEDDRLVYGPMSLRP